ncbi:hypothetical protein B0H13DRAFT_1993894, partial [Mycena leptocephala]
MGSTSCMGFCSCGFLLSHLFILSVSQLCLFRLSFSHCVFLSHFPLIYLSFTLVFLLPLIPHLFPSLFSLPSISPFPFLSLSHFLPPLPLISH